MAQDLKILKLVLALFSGGVAVYVFLDAMSYLLGVFKPNVGLLAIVSIFYALRSAPESIQLIIALTRDSTGQKPVESMSETNT